MAENYELIRLGPFTSGMNRAADPAVLEDTELLDCTNLELDIDGALVYRPAIQIIEQGATDERFLIFGGAHLSGTFYLFGTQDGSTFVSSDLGSTWSELNPDGASRECISMVVYTDKVWLPATPTSANGGMSWDPSGGAVAESDMPRGSACTVHKNRMYICPGETATSGESTLHFSDAADFTTWPGTNTIDVAQGDGTTLNDVIVYQDNLLIFKGESTHVLAYDLDPAEAILREINPVVGVHGTFSVVQHENTVYCLHHNKLYAIVNYNFQLLNLKIPFDDEQSLPANTTARYENQHISLFGDRLIVRFYNNTYVLGLRTQTWSEWRKTDPSSTVEWHVFGPLIRVHDPESSGNDSYYTGYSFDMDDSTGYKIIKLVDEHNDVDLEGFGDETFYCTATTKDYDFGDPVRHKRLFWWGADLISGNEIIADIVPITLTFSPTWEDLGDLQWNELNTWGQPLMTITGTQTTIGSDNIFNTNKFIKLRKSLRFRKANFSVRLETNGAEAQPTKLFSYIALIRTKAKATKQVS